MRRDDPEATAGVPWTELKRLAAALALFGTLLLVTPSREPAPGDGRLKPDALKARGHRPAEPLGVGAPLQGPAELTGQVAKVAGRAPE